MYSVFHLVKRIWPSYHVYSVFHLVKRIWPSYHIYSVFHLVKRIWPSHHIYSVIYLKILVDRLHLCKRNWSINSMIFHCFKYIVEYNVNPCCLFIIYLSVCFLSICLFVSQSLCFSIHLFDSLFIHWSVYITMYSGVFFCLVCFIHVINCSQLCHEL